MKNPSQSFASMSDAEAAEFLASKYAQETEKKFRSNNNFPVEQVSLPSQGFAYPKDHPLRKGYVEMKYMTAREEDILSSANLIKQKIVIDRLIEALIVDDIEYRDLVAGDKNALVIAARILSYGAEYKLSNIKCPACDLEQPYTVDLNTLTHKPITPELKESEGGQFKFTLPHADLPVVLKLLDGHDDIAVRNTLEASQDSATGIDRTSSEKLKRTIVSVDGDTNPKTVSEFVETSLFVKDSLAIRNYLSKVTPDIDRTIQFRCISQKCKYKETSLLTIGTNFFWPGV